MDSEVLLDNDFGEHSEPTDSCKTFTHKINFSLIRVLICSLVFVGLVFCKHFYAPYYVKISELYSASFKSDDEKILEIKNVALDNLKNLRLKIKEKINNL